MSKQEVEAMLQCIGALFVMAAGIGTFWYDMSKHGAWRTNGDYPPRGVIGGFILAIGLILGMIWIYCGLPRLISNPPPVCQETPKTYDWLGK